MQPLPAHWDVVNVGKGVYFDRDLRALYSGRPDDEPPVDLAKLADRHRGRPSRADAVVRALMASRVPMSIRAISWATGLSKTSVSRHVQTCVFYGQVTEIQGRPVRFQWTEAEC